MVARKPYDHLLFLSRGSGFHFVSAPPPNLRDLVYDQDPRIAVNAVLANALEGDFDHFTRLIDLMRTHDDGVVWGDCAALYSYAAPYSALREMMEAFAPVLFSGRDIVSQQWISEILCKSGALWCVPYVLKIFRLNTEREHYFATPMYLSRLLEEERDDIANGPPILPRTDVLPEWFNIPLEYNDDSFEERVMTRHSELCDLVAESDRAAVWEGRPLSLVSIAEKARTRIEAGEDIEEISIARAWLEATTGENFSSWYNKDNLLANLTASAHVETLLRSRRLEAFIPGHRYFFSRRIPD
ncbi:hypothetical protein SAMN05660489_04697 [Pseudomonas sp. LAMO17WK12:I10]|uniref:hypothetical protein n=1 Tax=unclassified Pseudomonas TaxID=196821 RepID=UPI000BDA628D|nr:MULTISPECIES: hypothetical protein [unclassified Pseudomonas]PXX58251.1 hypothetical protein H160_05054 [Pseudomonas sp. LAMO17WK12:I9]SNY47682.1 hypothetical protein SAMN05660489_04697 [Pseudomonas sp. LAMO17WK12:I10]